MYKKTIFEKVAEKFHTTPEEVYAEIQKAIDAGFDNPDPKVQAKWRKVKMQGERPTPEEVINYALGELKAAKR
ncbi:MAG: sporulation initiation factor Spo0A C-terminal domain-containing protein [Mediterraneibacter gnavus]